MRLRRVGAAAAALLLLCVVQLQGRKLEAAHNVDFGPCTPQQLHISLTGNPSEMRVSWKTHSSSCPSSVTVGPAEALQTVPMDASLLRSHHGSQHSYSARDMCAAPARHFGFGPTFLHTAVVTGLAPRRRYFYQVEGGRPVEFVSPVPAGPRHSFRFLVFGDMGESEHASAKSPGAKRTVGMLRDEQLDGAELVLHIGDLSYANGREEVWDTFMESIEPFAQHIPYMVGTGNHEYDYERGRGLGGGPALADPSGEEGPYQPEWGNYGNDSGGECGVQISNRFPMPDVSDFGYWGRNLTAAAADALAAEFAVASSSGSSSSSSNGGGSAQGAAAAGNPTLGPDAGAFLRRAAALADAERQAGEAAAAAGNNASSDADAGNRAAVPNPPFWYSFSHGSVHFVVVSTEHNLEPGSRQYRWLEADLRRVDRCVTPWVVLGAHRPMYVVYPHKSNRVVGNHLRGHLEDLLNRYQVDLVVSGHVHSYSRTCNVLDEACVPASEGGMTHIIVGCAGHKLTDIAHGQEEWLEYATVQYGYGRVTVDSGFSMLFELVGEDGRVLDSVKLHNSRANTRGCGYGQLADEPGDACGGGGVCPPWALRQHAWLQQPKGAAQAALHTDA